MKYTTTMVYDGKKRQKTFSSCHEAKSLAGKLLQFKKARVKVVDQTKKVWFQGCMSKGVTINLKSQD